MIVEFKNGKITQAILGNAMPAKDQFFVPDHWSLEDAENYLLDQTVSVRKHIIDESNPDSPFELLQINS